MAQLPIVSGGAQPVFTSDQRFGPQLAANVAYSPAGVPTNFMGPHLDFFGMNLSGGNANPFTQAQVQGGISLVLQTLQEVSTIAIYQVANTTNNTNFSFASYPQGAFNTAQDGTDNSATNIAALVSGLGNVSFQNGSSFDFSGSTCYNVGFRLASTATAAC